ncbi:hypothetical protein D3C79_659150 [compost metagenome]
MLRQVSPTCLTQQPVTCGALPGNQRFGTGMADQQQHTRHLVAGLGLLDLLLQYLELLMIIGNELRGLLLGAEQHTQLLEVCIHGGEVSLAGEQLHPNAGFADLRKHRWRPHLFCAHQYIRAQAEDALCGQLALVTDTWQALE